MESQGGWPRARPRLSQMVESLAQCSFNVYSHTNRRCSFLGSIFEGSDEVWHVIVVILNCTLTVEVSESTLQELVLLWSDLLEDIWHHIFKLLGLGSSGNNQQVFSHGELG